MTATALLSGLETVEKAMRGLLRGAASDLKDLGSSTFVSHKLNTLGKLISIYCDCFDGLGVQTRQELAQLCSRGGSDVLEAYDDLLNAEVDWNHFLQNLDSLLADGSVDSAIDFRSVGLVDARTEEHVSVEQLFRKSNIVLVLLRHFA
eukprot:m.308740 g.308740  ORF g.308740 m.308740 type:complete len:148 (+) comp44661_c0_seq1:157-600(+)